VAHSRRALELSTSIAFGPTSPPLRSQRFLIFVGRCVFQPQRRLMMPRPSLLRGCDWFLGCPCRDVAILDTAPHLSPIIVDFRVLPSGEKGPIADSPFYASVPSAQDCSCHDPRCLPGEMFDLRPPSLPDRGPLHPVLFFRSNSSKKMGVNSIFDSSRPQELSFEISRASPPSFVRRRLENGI